MMPKRVFFAVLNMGLGHATRSLPLIREFRRQGWHVLIGSNGRARDFLIVEEPDATHIETPDYQVRYSQSRLGLFPVLGMQIPNIRRQIHRETELCRQIVGESEIDLIVSDHCYGMYHPHCPSVFISHQIYFAMPQGLAVFKGIPAAVNRYYHKRFTRVVIPDLRGAAGGMLSGELSRLPDKQEHYCYCGPLSSVERLELDEDIDLLVSISGPEPQRSILERQVLADIENLPGRKVVTLGKSEAREKVLEKDGLLVYPHLPRQQMEQYLNRARLVLSRPGYSTLMELAELGKKALLVPTPGQTEQEYLARNLLTQKFFYAVNQKQLNLRRDVPKAIGYPGYNQTVSTQESINTFFEVVSELLAIRNPAKNKS